MPKLRRRLLACLTILSLLLCLATVGLWVRSYWRQDQLIYHTLDLSHRSFYSEFGEVFFFSAQFSMVEFEPGWHVYTKPASANGVRKNWVPSKPGDRTVWFIGFGYLFPRPEPDYYVRGVCFPHWFLALLFAILPAIRLRSILRIRRRNRAGLCPACGYDLRATPDRCPECGREAAERMTKGQ